ncbi:hypothetical protein ES708_21916 [subsurface metagenome]
MTEIEELIKQAEAQKKKWRLPKREERTTDNRTWQEIMDGRGTPDRRHR